MTYRIVEPLARMLLRGQVDKAGRTAFEHAERVARSDYVVTYGEYMAALLHDVLEDTQATAEDLLAIGVDAEIVADVVALTRQKGETYAQYIARVAQARDGVVRIKLADLADHLAPTAGYEMPASLRQRYENAQAALLIARSTQATEATP